ncbi:hypothetical protein CPLU01_05904 [Colletotrichum plurivorum]|uniref:Uncharacterized protein n=1 Tax=Colletotrichum plurivorum TaxID=2175906 RepID=A0A8H6KKM1_9PEZI|nr:hypothetical protein CPLU01_05904 [Colletotrichum plurivorum]
MEPNENPRETRPLIETAAIHPDADSTLSSHGFQKSSLQQVPSHDAAHEDTAGPTDCTPTDEKFRRANADPFVVIADLLCVLCPVGFLVLAVISRRLEGSATDDTSLSNWRNAVAISATLFPILFAAIIGRLMSQVARWRLGRGSTMGALEQLMGSRTVGGTVLSVLRLLETRLAVASELSSVVHFDAEAYSRFDSWNIVSSSSVTSILNELSIINAMYNTLLHSPDAVKNDTMDVWGNVKIPVLSSFGDHDSKAGWQDVPKQHAGREFSLLVGIPITGVAAGNTSFSLESSYVHLDCDDIKADLKSYEKNYFPKPVLFNKTSLTASVTYESVANGTWQGFNLNGTGATWNLAVDTFVASELWGKLHRPILLAEESGIQADPTTLLFQYKSQLGVHDPPDYYTSRCRATQRYVVSRVHCRRDPSSSSARRSCEVVAQRVSRKSHALEDVSQLSFPRVFRSVSGELPLATKHRGESREKDISLNYLVNPYSVTTSPANFSALLVQIPPRLLGLRLAQLVNSYLLLSQAFTSMPGRSSDPGATFEPNITVPVEVQNLVEVYRVPGLWMLLFMLSCVVLFFGAVAGAVITHLTLVPDLMGYVSSSAAFLSGDPPPELPPIPSLGRSAGNPTMQELVTMFDLQHLVRCAEKMHLHSNRKGPELRNAKSKRFHRSAYHIFIAGAMLSRAYHEPFFKESSAAKEDFMDAYVAEFDAAMTCDEKSRHRSCLCKPSENTQDPSRWDYLKQFVVYDPEDFETGQLDRQAAVFDAFADWAMQKADARAEKKTYKRIRGEPFDNTAISRI